MSKSQVIDCLCEEILQEVQSKVGWNLIKNKITKEKYLVKTVDPTKHTLIKRNLSATQAQDFEKRKTASKSNRMSKRKIEEDVPTMSAGSGQIAGIGVGAQGEPGVDLAAHKKKKRPAQEKSLSDIAMEIAQKRDLTTEDLRDWFGKGKEGGVGGGGWDRYNTKGERIGKCGDADARGGKGEGKPKCLSKEKAAQLRAKGGKKAIANAVRRKKQQDPVTDRKGTGNAPRPVSNRIGEETTPNDHELNELFTELNAMHEMWGKITDTSRVTMSEDLLEAAKPFTQGDHVVLLAVPSKTGQGDGRGYWKVGKNVFRAPIKNVLFDINGEPMDKRWESTFGHFNRYFDSTFGQHYKKAPTWKATLKEEDCGCDHESVTEASKYQGRKVTLGKPFRTPDGPRKFSVYVRNDKGNVVKVNFGDPNMEIKRDDPARRKNFRARHNCDNPGPRWKARYWSCRWGWGRKPLDK